MKLKNVHEKFLLPENPPGAGLLYYMRYSSERVDSHRRSIVLALENMGVRLNDCGKSIEVEATRAPESSYESFIYRVGSLLEELSVLNEASEYHDFCNGSGRRLEDTRDKVNLTCFNLISHHKYEEALDYVSRIVPQFTSELRLSDQNNCLYNHERKILLEIEGFCSRQRESLLKIAKAG